MSSAVPSPRLIAILGPTASGKTAVAVALAHRLGGEVVSCDAMLVYRGLDIGTAKPNAAEQAGIPHHLVDVVAPTEPFDARRYRDAADAVIREILAQGRWPILCGGTGLYARVLLYGLPLRPHDAAVAAAVRAAVAAGRRAELLAELAASGAVVPPAVRENDRRLQRAVEVLRLTGQGPDGAGAGAVPPPYAGPQWVLLPTPELTRRRVQSRTRHLLASGWLEETRRLVADGLLDTPTASQALGYREVADFLAGRIANLAELEALIVTRTCQYAKRQRTWFRRQHPGARLIELAADYTPAALAERVLVELPAALAASAR